MDNDSPQLSERQLEILALVSKGCSNPDIAKLLNLSQNTVKTHLSNILKQLDLSNRTEASVWFEQHYRSAAIDDQMPLQLICSGQQQTSSQFSTALTDALARFELIHLAQLLSSTGYLLQIEDAPEQRSRLVLTYQESSAQHYVLWTGPAIQTGATETVLHYAALIVAKMQGNQATLNRGNTALPSGFEALYSVEFKLRHRSVSQLIDARQIMVQLQRRYPQWPLMHSVNVLVIYASLIEGYLEATPERLAEMTASAQQACNMAPDSAYAHLAFTLYCIISRRHGEALIHIQQALLINPALEYGLFLLGQVQALNGHYQEALQSYDRYLAIFPEGTHSGRSYAGKALIHYLAGQYTEAKNQASQAILYNQTVQAGLQMVLLSVAVRESDSAQIAAITQQLQQQMASNAMQLANIQTLVAAVMPPTEAQRFFADLAAAGLPIAHNPG
ncbi:LuxR C-terminal-related transcriptional regulator [Gallaecimonas mangrovi]|uniref:LuxR C-terminal-related transcriptional regulator n=1 Tax=Gallaecimonas mangrovi TaxID=2291597 RepID=UPI000E1FF0A7|nr:LuxR C-terminal-related transcriptional regulator [Gallaecimonas mangrovi]